MANTASASNIGKNKRELKKSLKENEKVERVNNGKPDYDDNQLESEVPLTINFNKVLLEEKKVFLLNFARVKLSKI